MTCNTTWRGIGSSPLKKKKRNRKQKERYAMFQMHLPHLAPTNQVTQIKSHTQFFSFLFQPAGCLFFFLAFCGRSLSLLSHFFLPSIFLLIIANYSRRCKLKADPIQLAKGEIAADLHNFKSNYLVFNCLYTLEIENKWSAYKILTQLASRHLCSPDTDTNTNMGHGNSKKVESRTRHYLK